MKDRDYTDEVRFFLADIKDRVTETQEPDLNDPSHQDWLVSTWDEFDNMKAKDVVDDKTPYEEVNNAVREGKTIGDIFDILTEIDSKEV